MSSLHQFDWQSDCAIKADGAAGAAQTELPPTAVENITTYLRLVVALEQSVYAQNQAIDQIQEKIGNLGLRRQFSRPEMPPLTPLFQGAGDGLSVCGLGALIGALVGTLWGSFLIGILAGAAIAWTLVLIYTAVGNHASNRELEAGYRQRYLDYKRAVADDNTRVKREIQERAGLMAALEKMEEQRQETAGVLRSFYDKDVIFPKYRNLAAVCGLYESFASGRCSALTGVDGAYRELEEKARTKGSYARLDTAISHLEQIKESQHTFYETIQEGNRMTQALVEEALRQQPEKAPQYARIKANNREAASWLTGAGGWLSEWEKSRASEAWTEKS